jgi:hypothetical protein
VDRENVHPIKMFSLLKAAYPPKSVEEDWVLVEKDDVGEKESVLSDVEKNNFVLEAISRDLKQPAEAEWKTVTSKKRRKQKAF